MYKRQYLRLRVAQTLGMNVDRLDAATPLSTMGFDSLMAVQLKNRIETDLALAVPMIRFLQGPSVDELVPAMEEALAAAGEAQPTAGPQEEETWEAGSV